MDVSSNVSRLILNTICWKLQGTFNKLRPRQDGLHFAYEILKCTFLNEICCILIKISVKCVHKGPIDNNPAFVQIMAWRRKATSHYLNQSWPRLLTHICVSRPQWVKCARHVEQLNVCCWEKRSLDHIESPIPYILSRGWHNF